MNGLRMTTLVLACALFAPAMASAKSQPLDPATIQARIAKRGVGSWICVQETNGIALVGRVVSINDDSVGLQLQNYPDITPVLYTDIASVRFGISRKTFWTVTAIGFGAVAAMAAVGIHEINANKPPPFPTPAVR
jgi:hypothetical protein